MYSLRGIHSRIPLRAPHTHSHSLVCLTTTGNRKKKISEQHVTTRSVNKNAIKPNLTLTTVEMNKDLLVGVCHERQSKWKKIIEASSWIHETPITPPSWASLMITDHISPCRAYWRDSCLLPVGGSAGTRLYCSERTSWPGSNLSTQKKKKHNTEITGRIYKKR